jgi:hypothetical protein
MLDTGENRRSRENRSVLAWIIHDFAGEKRKDALKEVMNTGF